MNGHRIQVLGAWRETSAERIAQQCLLLITALDAVHPACGAFRVELDGERAGKSAGDAATCRRAVDDATTRFWMGRAPRVAWTPHFFLPPGGAVTGDLTLTFGDGPAPLPGLFTPWRVDLLLAGDLGDAEATRAALENVLRAMVAVFRPDTGFVGTHDFPTPATSIFSSGRPVIGWMTYLAAERAVAKPLPRGATADPVANLGTLFTASSPDRASVDQLAVALAG